MINQLRNEVRLEASIRLLATEVYEKWVSVVSPEDKIRNSVDAPATASSGDEAEKNGSISLLQSLADEVSESIKKEETVKRTSSSSSKSSKDDGRHKKHSSGGERRSSLSSSSEKRREREKEEVMIL